MSYKGHKGTPGPKSKNPTLVIKKNGELEEFDISKITNAAKKAFLSVGYTDEEAEAAGQKVSMEAAPQVWSRDEVHRDEIHDIVQLVLMDHNKNAAVAYIQYRLNARNKHGSMDTLINAIRSITAETSKDNANMGNSPSSKMYQIGSEMSKYYTLNHVLPKDIAAAHVSGDIHLHDLDYFSTTYNCLNYDLGKILHNGFNMPHGFIRQPKSIQAAASLAAVTLQSCQNDEYGGIGVNDIDIALKDYVLPETTDREIDQAMEGYIFNLQ